MTTTISTDPIDPSNFSKYSRITTFCHYYHHNSNDWDLCKELLDPAYTVYVGFNQTGKARYGSVGKLRWSGNPVDRSLWQPLPSMEEFRNNRNAYAYISSLVVDFDDGRTVNVCAWNDSLVWIKDYEGPTRWIFTKKAKDIPAVVHDRLGEVLAVGDFVAFVGRAKYTTGMGDLYFGSVTKISHKGTVYVKNIKLDDDDKSEEMRLTYPERATKLDKEILNKLILKKLTF